MERGGGGGVDKEGEQQRLLAAHSLNSPNTQGRKGEYIAKSEALWENRALSKKEKKKERR